MRTLLALAASATVLLIGSTAAAQFPPFPLPFPTAPQPQPPAPGQPQPAYGQPQPAYGQPAYGNGYGQPPPNGYGQPAYGTPPPNAYRPSAPDEPLVSVRINPLQLFFKQIAVEGELAVHDYVSVELAPTFSFGLNGGSGDDYSAHGYGASVKAGFWPQGHALNGFYLKGVGQLMHYSAKSDYGSVNFNEPGLGLMLGSQTIFGGGNSGFTFSAGVGAMYLFTSDHGLQVDPTPATPGLYHCGNDSFSVPVRCLTRSSVTWLGQLAIGYTF